MVSASLQHELFKKLRGPKQNTHLECFQNKTQPETFIQKDPRLWIFLQDIFDDLEAKARLECDALLLSAWIYRRGGLIKRENLSLTNGCREWGMKALKGHGMGLRV